MVVVEPFGATGFLEKKLEIVCCLRFSCEVDCEEDIVLGLRIGIIEGEGLLCYAILTIRVHGHFRGEAGSER